MNIRMYITYKYIINYIETNINLKSTIYFISILSKFNVGHTKINIIHNINL